MVLFQDFPLTKFLFQAIEELGFTHPTPVQEESFSVIRSGKDVVGISQTGTGKTIAYALPILQDLKFSNQAAPRVLILVPTRELVLQVVEQIEQLTTYIDTRVRGVYGGVNINTQAAELIDGMDILVATPGRLYDLVLNRVVQLKSVKQLVIDEVDVMLDLGFRFQLTNIFDLLPERRQNIMFSATMTEEVEELIETTFWKPHKISIAPSGTPLENIDQTCIPVYNFYTKVNLLRYLLKNSDDYKKVLVFVSSKKIADRLHEKLHDDFFSKLGVIHSNKSQNHRMRTIENFDAGQTIVLIATDIIARGLDLDEVTHVINFDVPIFPENYMHRIGRTGRAERKGNSLLFYTESEECYKEAIEELMDLKIKTLPFPEEVEISQQKAPEERPKMRETVNHHRNAKKKSSGEAFHEKKEKNKKVNAGSSYHREIKTKFKKPKTKGDKIANRKNKRK